MSTCGGGGDGREGEKADYTGHKESFKGEEHVHNFCSGGAFVFVVLCGCKKSYQIIQFKYI